MHVFISGPMRGIPMSNFPAFDAAAGLLERAGHTVFNPAEHDRRMGVNGDEADRGVDIHPTVLAMLMTEDLAAVLEADACAFLPGWERSRGARLERAVAEVAMVPCYDLVAGRFLVPHAGRRSVTVRTVVEWIT